LWTAALIALALPYLVATPGCGPMRRGAGANPERYEPSFIETGQASWYGQAFAGRRTASGEIFRPEALTAAHRTLPLGSVVRVTNLENGRSIVVRINDRGPFARRRVLDCSRGAARALGFQRQGVARVAIDWPPGADPGRFDKADWWLQLGAFSERANAERLKTRLEAHVASVALHQDEEYVRVHSGPFGARAEAEAALRQLVEAGFNGNIVMLDPNQERVR
jgi:rare lipoprotein A